jgi:hypothetical protein
MRRVGAAYLLLVFRQNVVHQSSRIRGGIQMVRALCISLLAMLILTLVGSGAIAQQRRPISQEIFEWIIQNEPLVFRGEVTKVDVKLVTPRELGAMNNTVKIPVTEVTMKIEKVIAGDYESDEIQIIVGEGKLGNLTGTTAGFAIMEFNVGDHAIVALRLNSQGTGYNILDDDEAIFRVEGTKLIPYRKEYSLEVDKPLEIMAKKAREREMPEIIKASDLICTGTVAKLIDMDSRFSSRRLIVSINETLKGTAEKSEISVNMSNVFLPSTVQAPGFRVMLFLKKDGSGYRPVAGVNGYYAMDGERLARGHITPVKLTASQLKSTVKNWKEAQR